MAEGEPTVSIRERLLKERLALLDLSTRNRLLNTPLRTNRNRAIEIVDEKATEVFRLLTDSKSLTFLPGIQLSEAEREGLDPEDKETGGIPQPEEGEALDARGFAARHSDLRLQTRLTSEGLQKRLFDIWYDARTLEEEQGVNILYLAVGLLRWYDKDTSEVARHAPLILLPVELERNSAAEKFRLKWRNEPASPNLTLQAKLKAEFNIVLEDFANEDEVDVAAYCARAAELVSSQPRWEVLPDAMVLGFFSFAKFLMYRDLDPDNWPSAAPIDGHAMVTALLRDGFPQSDPLVADDVPIDQAIPPLELRHVVDADSSQAIAIAEAAGGRTMVIKGPPGTGKSQTITNVIAAAAARGKKVLFVAEKMAALDVVHRRLRQAGLGPLTLELHSNKVNKRLVLEELKRTKDAVVRAPRGDVTVVQKLGEATDRLNAFARRLHQRLEPCGLTPHQIVAKLVRATAAGAPSGFALTGADAWTPEDAADRRRRMIELAERQAAMGPASSHPWRGVQRDALDPSELETLGRGLAEISETLRLARQAAERVAGLLEQPSGRTVEDLDRIACEVRAATSLPPSADRAALRHPMWVSAPEALTKLVEAGERREATVAALGGQLNDAGWAADFAPIRAAVVTKGASLFRFLDGNYRAQIALLKSYLTAPPPPKSADRLALIDKVIAAQNARRDFEASRAVGEAFGASWKGEDSVWAQLRALVDWRTSVPPVEPTFWGRLAEVDVGALRGADEQLARSLPVLTATLDRVFTDLRLDLKRAFGVAGAGQIDLDDLTARLASWTNGLEGATRYIAFASKGRELSALGAGALVEAALDGTLDAQLLVPSLDRAYAETLRSVLFAAWPELKAFDGESQNRLIERFRELDRTRIQLAKEEIAGQHAAERPKGLAGVGPLGVLNAELAKKRAHLPIRQLLDKAGPAIQQLKPVFMMSPLSVAQFLKPGGLTFDLLVMDEASQIEPVDSLGAIARAAQIVVVGDERQLPPTSFFKKLTGEDERDEDSEEVTIQAKDAESILDLCLAKGAPSRMLNWHYRSRHQSLIAVSNKEFYENKLFIVPSPYDAVAGMGLKFNLLKNAPYDRGGTRTNPVEARMIAERVMQHGRETPGASLGVATFSVSQRQAILKELELLRRADPSVEDFFAGGSIEPFFVKNLENIQGDERDVILISVGYGKTEQGYLAHGFGPLSREGGERRLNVLISRAKQRCEVFSNFTGADIDLERTRARGVVALKLFLTFAETGKFGLGEELGLDHDSEFEAEVCERLRALGYDVKAQIGASGFRVDLAVADPEKPGRFVLGIECDGAQYHSSRSARDRDRLRQQVLEDHGWIIHRIWSADWYLRPQEELAKVEAAIGAAKAEWRERDETGLHQRQAVPVSFETEVANGTETVTAVVSVDAEPAATPQMGYREAEFYVNTSVEPHEAPLADMAAYVVKIVECEGPIHEDEIATRIRMLWGLARAGGRIRSAVALAVKVATQRGFIEGGPFYGVPGQTVVVRNRAEVQSATLRKPEMLPPQEIDTALLMLIDENYGAGRAELLIAASRLFGFSAMSAQLKATLDARVEALLAGGALTDREGLLVRARAGAA